jgi:hypothetical protein
MTYIDNPQAGAPRLYDLEGLTDEAPNLWEEYEESFAAAPFAYGIMEIERVLRHMKGLTHQLGLHEIADADMLLNMIDHIKEGNGIEVKSE